MCDSGTHVQPTQKDGGKGSATRLGCSGAPLRPGDCRPAAFALTHGTALRRRRRHARCSTPSAADAKHGAKSRPETCIRTHSVEPVRYSPACAHALTVKRPPTSPQTKSLCSAAVLCTSRAHKNRPAPHMEAKVLPRAWSWSGRARASRPPPRSRCTYRCTRPVEHRRYWRGEHPGRPARAPPLVGARWLTRSWTAPTTRVKQPRCPLDGQTAQVAPGASISPSARQVRA